jgi:hypothetical protein
LEGGSVASTGKARAVIKLRRRILISVTVKDSDKRFKPGPLPVTGEFRDQWPFFAPPAFNESRNATKSRISDFFKR